MPFRQFCHVVGQNDSNFPRLLCRVAASVCETLGAAADLRPQSCRMAQLSIHLCWIMRLFDSFISGVKHTDDEAARAGPVSWAVCSCFELFYSPCLHKSVRSCLHLMKHFTADTVMLCEDAEVSSLWVCLGFFVAMLCFVVHKGATISPLVSKPDDFDKVNRWGQIWRREEESRWGLTRTEGEIKVDEAKQDGGVGGRRVK